MIALRQIGPLQSQILLLTRSLARPFVLQFRVDVRISNSIAPQWQPALLYSTPSLTLSFSSAFVVVVVAFAIVCAPVQS